MSVGNCHCYYNIIIIIINVEDLPTVSGSSPWVWVLDHVSGESELKTSVYTLTHLCSWVWMPCDYFKPLLPRLSHYDRLSPDMVGWNKLFLPFLPGYFVIATEMQPRHGLRTMSWFQRSHIHWSIAYLTFFNQWTAFICFISEYLGFSIIEIFLAIH